MIEIFHPRIKKAHDTLKKLERNPAPTVPFYNVSLGEGIGGCPFTGRTGKVLKIGSGVTDSYISKTGFGGNLDTSYYLSVDVYIPGIASASHSDVFSCGGFMNVSGTQQTDSYVYWNTSFGAWRLEFADGSINRSWPVDCSWHTIWLRYLLNSDTSAPQIQSQCWLDGGSVGTANYGSNNPPDAAADGIWCGTEFGSSVSIPYYFDNLKFGTSLDGSELFSNDLEAGFAGWSQFGSVSNITSP